MASTIQLRRTQVIDTNSWMTHVLWRVTPHPSLRTLSSHEVSGREYYLFPSVSLFIVIVFPFRLTLQSPLFLSDSSVVSRTRSSKNFVGVKFSKDSKESGRRQGWRRSRVRSPFDSVLVVVGRWGEDVVRGEREWGRKGRVCTWGVFFWGWGVVVWQVSYPGFSDFINERP